MPMLYSHMPYHNDTIIKTQKDFFINICTAHFIVRVRKGLLKVCMWEGAGDRTETAIFWPPLLWPSALCLSRSPGLLNQRPRGSAFCLLSLLHLISNFSRPQLNRRLWAPLAWCGFPYHISSITPSELQLQLLSWLSYIIVQRPLSRLLDFWNHMFDRH